MSEERQPPGPVVLVAEDGTEIPCTMHRDPAMDRPPGDPRGEVTYWRAVPDCEGELPLATWKVKAGVVKPPHTGFWVDMPLVEGGLGAIGRPS